MNTQCARSGIRIDERAARMTALFVVIALAAFVRTSAGALTACLFVDFALRAFRLGRFSPFALVSRWVLRFLRVAPVPVDAGPKIFAARLGLAFASLLGLLAILNSHVAALVVAVFFALPAALEAFFGYCVGCRIYSLIQHAQGLRLGRSTQE